MDVTTETTRILSRISEGTPEETERLLSLVYEELRSIAARYFQNQPADHTLQPTALVHEAFLKLVDRTVVSDWQSRAHFLAVSATAMRQILVDHARAGSTAKRGGERLQLALDEALTPMSADADLDLIALHEALAELTRMDERQGRIVEMRFFGGMKVKEIAEVLGCAKTTVDNLWRAARAWLNARLLGNLP